MSVTEIPDDLPLLKAYLDSTLVVGAYPACVCKAAIYRHALEALATPLDTAGLPKILRDHIEAPSPPSAWVPVSIAAAVHLVILERAFGDERRYLDFIYQMAANTIRTPMYRTLFVLVGAERLARTGPMRWGAFFRGLQYNVNVLDTGATGQYGFPPGLLPAVLMRAVARSIEAAVHAAGAERAVVRVVETGETHAITRTEWNPPRRSSFPPPG
jgi:hypothetical protein